MTDIPVVYTDDDDAHVDWPLGPTDAPGIPLDWVDPTAAIGPGPYDVGSEWLGDPAPQRWLRVPMSGLAARTSPYTVYLKVPGGSDIRLGTVLVRERI